MVTVWVAAKSKVLFLIRKGHLERWLLFLPLPTMTSSFFTYNKAKVIQALRYHFITRKEIKTMLILVNVFAILSAGLFFFKKISPLAFLVSSVLWFTLMIAFWFVLPNIIYKKAATFKDGFKVTLEDKHLFLENDRGSKSWPWTAFSSFIESPHFFHLYFDSRSFFLIPKDAFADNALVEAKKILNDKINKKR
ncbi:MAG: YcxB family protein [Bacteroidota bacterium]|nr:YcxB family protein [Bacteroidota bacterium]